MQRAAAAVVDTTVILNLAKLRLLDKLTRLIGRVYLPQSVQREAKLYGRQRRRRDVIRFKKAAIPCSHWREQVFQTALAKFRRASPAMSGGEAEMIAQAEFWGVRLVLTDDHAATIFAGDRGLEVWATPRLLGMLAREP
ncbi:MAG: hypothetical protein ACYDCL_21290 [Myxococcales bacterium]